MKNKKMIGAILLALGVGLAIWGYQLSGSVGSQMAKAISGSYTRQSHDDVYRRSRFNNRWAFFAGQKIKCNNWSTSNSNRTNNPINRTENTSV